MEFELFSGYQCSGSGVCILCISVCFCLFCWYFYSKRRKNPALVYWPLIGMLPSLAANSHRLSEWFEEVFFSVADGDPVGSFFIEGPVLSKLTYLVTCHPDNIVYILKTNFSNFPKGPAFKQIFDFLADGILGADGESWKYQRKMIHAIFTSVEFRSSIATTTRKLVESELLPFLAHAATTQGSIFDLQDICKRFASDTTMKVLTGKDDKYLTRDLPHNSFHEAMEFLQEGAFYRHTMPLFGWKLLRLLNIGREKEMAKAKRTVELIVSEYMSLKREGVGETAGDILSMSIKLTENSSMYMMNDTFLRDVMVSLYFDGRDTIVSSLVWFFAMVAKTPHVEKKIVEELKSVALKKNEGTSAMKIKSPWVVFDFEDVSGLAYLHAAICECLRLYPPLPNNSKAVLKKDILPDGTVVKPGMQILIAQYAQGHMPWIWGEDSLDFKPERWIDEEGKLHKDILSKFLSFSTGPRSCLGKDTAFKQVKVVVSAVLFNFHVEIVDGHQLCSKPGISLDIKNGLPVTIRERII